MKLRHDKEISVEGAVRAVISLRGKGLKGSKLGDRCLEVAREFDKEGSDVRKKAEEILKAFPSSLTVPVGAVFFKAFHDISSEAKDSDEREHMAVVAMAVALGFMSQLADVTEDDEDDEDDDEDDEICDECGCRIDEENEADDEDEDEDDDEDDVRLAEFVVILPENSELDAIEKVANAFVEDAKERTVKAASDPKDVNFKANVRVFRQKDDGRIKVAVKIRTLERQFDKPSFRTLMLDLKCAFTDAFMELSGRKSDVKNSGATVFEGHTKERPSAERLTKTMAIVKSLFGDDSFENISSEYAEEDDGFTVRVNVIFTEEAKNDRLFKLKTGIAEKLVALSVKS